MQKGTRLFMLLARMHLSGTGTLFLGKLTVEHFQVCIDPDQSWGEGDSCEQPEGDGVAQRLSERLRGVRPVDD